MWLTFGTSSAGGGREQLCLARLWDPLHHSDRTCSELQLLRHSNIEAVHLLFVEAMFLEIGYGRNSVDLLLLMTTSHFCIFGYSAAKQVNLVLL